jgi:hypothetical protein
MSRKKKNNKKPVKNQSLSERLSRRWNDKKWDAFLSLYMRDRDASDRTKQAPMLSDAYYNCLAQTLFAYKDVEGASAVAKMMLSEENLGPDDARLRGCARLTIDIEGLKNGALDSLSELPDDIELPEPFGAMRLKISVALSSAKKGKKSTYALRKDSLPGKLEKQFGVLRKAKTVAPYSTFLAIAEKLELETANTASARTFTALRAIASLLRELVSPGKKGGQCEPWDVIRHQNFVEIPRSQSHPSVFALWNFLCETGGKKYGREWELAVRVMQIKFSRIQFGYARAYDQLSKRQNCASYAELPLVALFSYDGWTEHERYVMSYLAIRELSTGCRDFFLQLEIGQHMTLFMMQGDIGRKWRPENPWPAHVKSAFEILCEEKGFDTVEYAVNANLPYEAMSARVLVFMSLYSPKVLLAIKDKAARLLPLRLSEGEASDVASFFTSPVTPIETMRFVSSLLDAESLAETLRSLMDYMISISLMFFGDGASLDKIPWNDLSNGHIEFVAENLPDDDQVGCFCKLCRGMKRYRLSGNAEAIEAFFAAQPRKNGVFGLLLSFFLMGWPDVSPRFIVKLFELSLKGNDMIFDIPDILTLVEKIPHETSKREIVLGLVSALKKHFALSQDHRVKQMIRKLNSYNKILSPKARPAPVQKLLFIDETE